MQQTPHTVLTRLVRERHFEKAAFDPRGCEWGLGNYCASLEEQNSPRIYTSPAESEGKAGVREMKEDSATEKK